ncbi:hypothetical protein A1D29_01550 [Pasteurellaceae bacterium Orientalotternb1]|nr:hypothetical protein A1D29_01550 [Pasteurellaceae bacterium Orientalotternb1]
MKVPKGWSIEPLENICSIFDAQRIPLNNEDRQKRLLGKKPEELYPYYGSTGQVGYVDDFIFNGEYLLIGEDGAPFLENKDKAYIVNGKFWVNNHAHILKAKYSNQYLCYFLNQFDYRKYVTGATRLKLTQAALRSIPVLIPENVETQTQIAQILDKSTALIAKRKAQIAELDKLVQSVFLEMFGDPITNPKKWDVRKLSDIATYFNGLTYKPDQVSESGVVVLRSSNIQNSELCFKDTVKVSCPIKEKLWVKNNDILMCSRNGSANLVGKVALIENVEEKMTFGAFMMIIRSQFYQYLMVYFQTNAFRQQIKTGATTTINQITGAMLDRIELPIPSQELLNHFSKWTTKIHAQKTLLQKSLAELEIQHQALMQRAFNGQLVG